MRDEFLFEVLATSDVEEVGGWHGIPHPDRLGALLHVVGHDRFALLGSQGVEELDRRTVA